MNWREQNTKNWAKTLPDPTKKAPVRATILLIQEAVDNVLMSRDKVVSTDVLIVYLKSCAAVSVDFFMYIEL